MRTLSEEFRSGTYELLQTRPLTRWQIIRGKYLAVLVIMLIVLLPTLVYVATINSLAVGGEIDIGALAGAYIGLYLLSCVFAAIGICCSGFSNNAVVAFLIAAFSCLILYYGFAALSSLTIFEGSADYYIEMMGIDFHYRSISRGVVDTRELFYFGSMIFLFLFISVKNLGKR